MVTLSCPPPAPQLTARTVGDYERLVVLLARHRRRREAVRERLRRRRWTAPLFDTYR
jgi:predicted O-linked N-acetylglucosamine transferase (SPINDLY family)